MNQHEHRERHKLLHTLFDELMADFIAHTGKMPSTASVSELMEWSYSQTIEPHDGPAFFNKPHPYPK